MHKKIQKLTLHRETLRHLNELHGERLAGFVAGVPTNDLTQFVSCPPTACGVCHTHVCTV